MTCPSCGQEVPSEAKFCMHCASPMREIGHGEGGTKSAGDTELITGSTLPSDKTARALRAERRRIATRFGLAAGVGLLVILLLSALLTVLRQWSAKSGQVIVSVPAPEPEVIPNPQPPQPEPKTYPITSVPTTAPPTAEPVTTVTIAPPVEQPKETPEHTTLPPPPQPQQPIQPQPAPQPQLAPQPPQPPPQDVLDYLDALRKIEQQRKQQARNFMPALSMLTAVQSLMRMNPDTDDTNAFFQKQEQVVRGYATYLNAFQQLALQLNNLKPPQSCVDLHNEYGEALNLHVHFIQKIQSSFATQDISSLLQVLLSADSSLKDALSEADGKLTEVCNRFNIRKGFEIGD